MIAHHSSEYLAGMDCSLARGRSPGRYGLPLDGGRLSSTLGLPCDAEIADRVTRRATCRVQRTKLDRR